MELKYIELPNLKTTNLNVRKKGAKNIDDLLPSIRSLGIIQPLLVRPNCEGFEIVAGKRRYHSLVKLTEEGINDPVPCLVMEKGDDAKAIEASLAENVARLPMDEIDQYKAFSALIKKGNSADEIAAQFGITERLVTQRLAIANLYQPILTAYSKQEIQAEVIRALTMATKRQQKAWWALFIDDEQHAPYGRNLKAWLFGGANIPLENALFDLAEYKGATISDLFGENSYFDDAQKFWTLQNSAIAKTVGDYTEQGWKDVIILEIGAYWTEWQHQEVAKQDGGKVYVHITQDGEVTFHEGYLPEKEAKRLEQGEDGDTAPKPNAEITKAMQNYLDLHRHAAVRQKLLGANGVALRLAVAQIIAGSKLWEIKADPQKASTEAIAASLQTNKAEIPFSEERKKVRELLGLRGKNDLTIIPTKSEWNRSNDLYAIFGRLLELSDEEVTRILSFVVAETLPCGSALVEVLGKSLDVDLADFWQPDQTFFDLLRDKSALNAILKQLGGK